jgi:(S)-mandelate dehydrogenase
MLDSSMAPIDVLPEVVDAVGKRITVMMDSGIRRGADIVKALSLGARAVLIGRATLYGTAAGGEAGAGRAITILREEVSRVLALIGARDVAELGPQFIKLPALPREPVRPPDTVRSNEPLVRVV